MGPVCSSSRPGLRGLVILATVVGGLAAGLGRAADAGTGYYVSPRGDDARAGTSAESAFRTIGKAASLAGPGAVIHVAPGTYAERVAPAHSGTETAPSRLTRCLYMTK